tara:strand:- start:5495 stop:6400 length:906 start_codon:yes stop_codon:yes gene_type:complete
MKIIHIGLGKAGSTTLQEEIFPRICKRFDLNFINLKKYVDDDNIEYNILEKHRNIEKKLPNRFIISQEDLIADRSEFVNLERSFEILKNNFSESTKVLIVLRNPYDLLNSIFLHNVQTLIAFEEKEFFYINSNMSFKNYIEGKYNLHKFNYKNIIKLYSFYFTNLIIVPFEKISNMNFLDELLENKVDEKFKNELVFIYKKKKYNKSISKLGVKTFYFLQKIINLKKIDDYMKINYNKKNKGLLLKIILRLYWYINLRHLFQRLIDKIELFYIKYKIEKKNIPINIDELVSEYYKLFNKKN